MCISVCVCVEPDWTVVIGWIQKTKGWNSEAFYIRSALWAGSSVADRSGRRFVGTVQKKQTRAAYPGIFGDQVGITNLRLWTFHPTWTTNWALSRKKKPSPFPRNRPFIFLKKRILIYISNPRSNSNSKKISTLCSSFEFDMFQQMNLTILVLLLVSLGSFVASDPHLCGWKWEILSKGYS